MDDLNEAKPDLIADAHAAMTAAEGQFDAALCTFKLNPTPANRARVQVALESRERGLPCDAQLKTRARWWRGAAQPPHQQ